MGLIPPEVVSQVLDRSDIVGVISSYIPLKPAGRNFKALCPFHHEKTPSFMVNPDKQIFHCFGCGVGGNVVSFVMQQDHLTFPEAVRSLAQKSGIAIPRHDQGDSPAASLRQKIIKINALAAEYFHENLLSDRNPIAKSARRYLLQRKIDGDAIKQFKLGLAADQWDGLITYLRNQRVSLGIMEKAGLIIPQNRSDGFYDRFRNRIIFPISDIKERCVAFGARTLESDNPAKYINSPETALYTKGKYLYGFHLAKDEIGQKDSVIVVEGYFDFITPFLSGVRNVVASLGTALTVDQIRLIRRYTKNVIMLFDSDPAGAKAMVRSFDLLVEEGMNVSVVTLAANEDPDSFIRKSGVSKFTERIEKALPLFDFKVRSLVNKFGLKTIEAKAAIADKMLPTIDKFENAIVKTEYIKKLAGILSVSTDAMVTQSKRLKEKEKSYRQTALSEGTSAKEVFNPRGAEFNLLALMLEEGECIPAIREKISLADFQNHHLRHVVAKVFDLYDAGKETNMSVLMGCFEDQGTLKFLAQLMAAESLLMGDRTKILMDCIGRMRGDRQRAQRLKIREKIALAKETGDHTRINELMKEFNQLIKG